SRDWSSDVCSSDLQGDKSVQAIIGQLERIAQRRDAYDVVAIIRGGGGDVGLSSYNNYLLASAIARFPIPVLTGIGHSTNETVSEMVAYKNAITPSELADFLIQRFHQFAVPIEQAQETIIRKTRELLLAQQNTLNEHVRYFRLHSIHLLSQQQKALGHHFIRLTIASTSRLRQGTQTLLHTQTALHAVVLGAVKDNRTQLTAMEKSVKLLDPQQVLNRGYSITRMNGQALKSAEHVKNGAILETLLASGQ